MKKVLSLLSVCFIGHTAYSQFTESNAPVIDDEIKLYVVDSTTTNFADVIGEGVTWDYSTITGYESDDSRIVKALDPADTSNGGMYGSSNLAIDIEHFFTSYQISDETGRVGTGFVFDGTDLGVGRVSAVFPEENPEILFEYPFEYGDEIEFETVGEITLEFGNPVVLDLDVNGISTVDGRGTLKLPGTDFENVLRYHLLDTLLLELVPGFEVQIIRNQFEYYDHTISNLPIFIHLNVHFKELMEDGIDDEIGIILSWIEPEISNNKTNVLENVQIFPNPSSGLININLPEQLNETSLEVTDVLGRSVFQTTIANSSLTLDLSNQPKGTYFVKLLNGESSVVKTVVLK